MVNEGRQQTQTNGTDMDTITSYEPRQATPHEEQERAERTRAALARFQKLLEQHPPQNGILHFRGWPADGQPLDRVEDAELAERMAEARRVDELERAALASAAVAASVAPAETEVEPPPEPITPATAPRPPPDDAPTQHEPRGAA